MGADESKQRSKREEITKKDVEFMLKQQKSELESMYKDLSQKVQTQAAKLQSSGSGTTTTGLRQPNSNWQHENPSPTTLERQQVPYSNTANDLQNGIWVTNAPNNTLYPNLSYQVPRATVRSDAQNRVFYNNNIHPNFRDSVYSSEGFEIIDKTQGQRIQPSAPFASMNGPSVRSRSTSSSRQRKKDNILYNCQTCKNSYGMRIYHCRNGHSLCHVCKERLVLCGICRSPSTEQRNYSLEGYIAEIKTPCKNEKDGCHLSFKLADMDCHLKECPFSDMNCPFTIFGICTWRGKISQLKCHFDDVHPHAQGDVAKEMSLNIVNNSQTVHLVVIGPFNFLMHMKVDKTTRCIYMMVQMLSTAMSSGMWNYELHIYNKRKPRIKYEYSDICSHIGVDINAKFREFLCASIPLSYAGHFANEKMLTYKFFIKKSNDKNTDNNEQERGRGRRYGRRR